MMGALVIIIELGFISVYILITWKAIEARENLNKEIDRVIEEIRKSKKL